MLAPSLWNDARLAVDAYAWSQWPRFSEAWATLAVRSPHATFFVSPEWSSTWLESFGAVLKPLLLVMRERGDVVGMCLLVRRTERRGPFAIRRIYLNTCGEQDRDSACTEFDTLLCEPGRELAVACALRAYLDELRSREPWDELVLSGFVEGAALDAMRAAFAPLHVTDRAKPSYYVDLAEIVASGKSYVSTLPSRMRTQFRHDVKHYGASGELHLEVAQNVEQAQAMLTELADLHQRTWTARGAAGSFSSPVFFDFHRRLIDRCFASGRIQLLRVRAGETTIGALYNYVDRGKVYFYQCGFDYHSNKKLSPGLVVQIHAIEHAIRLGSSEYDLMAGDVDYKRKLAAKHRDLHWVIWRAPGAKMRAFELLRDTKHWLERSPFADAVAHVRSRLAARS